MNAAQDKPSSRARLGDWIEVSGLPGRPARRGEVTEVLGEPGHEHYRVRWDEHHESLFFPTEGVHVVHPGRPPHAA
ncbi:MAG: DUF1918 domain-containing protein [Solirubrobacteraceae bacterium]